MSVQLNTETTLFDRKPSRIARTSTSAKAFRLGFFSGARNRWVSPRKGFSSATWYFSVAQSQQLASRHILALAVEGWRVSAQTSANRSASRFPIALTGKFKTFSSILRNVPRLWLSLMVVNFQPYLPLLDTSSKSYRSQKGSSIAAPALKEPFCILISVKSEREDLNLRPLLPQSSKLSL